MKKSVDSLLIGLLWLGGLAQTGGAASPREHTPRMSYLDNGTIRLGVDLNLGGAITYLSPSGRERNVVNNFDWGRQVQMSFYSGPVPFVAGEKRPKSPWEGLGWNPIQAGDDFGHGSKVTDAHNDGRAIEVRCIPMQWPLDNVPAECTFTCRIRLDGPAARVHCRLDNHRSDTTQYSARTQELPAVYTNGEYYRLMSYTGDRPFSGLAPARLDRGPGGTFPWISWLATESWAALVGDDGWGLGVWAPGTYQFLGGFAGEPGRGGTNDQPTGYIAPLRTEILDHNLRYEYEYSLILGTLDEIRRFVQDQPRPPVTPSYRFRDDRQGWSLKNARDDGWPLQGSWRIRLEQDDPQLIGPAGFWQAAENPTLAIRASLATAEREGRVFWESHGTAGFAEARSVAFPIVGDGRERTYQIDLSRSPNYRGAITGLRIDPVASGKRGDWVRIAAIAFSKESARPAAP